MVMKALALGLPHYLPLSPRCTHLKGHGGLKYAVRQGLAYLPHHHFVLKTDVRAYYASIDHQLLLDRLAVHIADRQIGYHRAVFPALCGAGWLILGPHARHRVGQPAQSDSGGVFLD
jgi:hypothetical protein